MMSLLSISWVVLAVPSLLAAGESRDKRAVDYAGEVKPILSKHCYACHGAVKQKAKLRLDTVASIHRGGDSGPAVVPGKRDESLIVDAVTGQDGWRMPPESEGSPLSSAEIATLTAWIDQGAKASADEQPQPDPRAHGLSEPPGGPKSPRPIRSARRLRGSATRSTRFWPPSIAGAGLRPAPPPTRRP